MVRGPDKKPRKPRAVRPPEERFWERVNVNGECWEWTARLNKHGYGLFYVGQDNILAHRWIYAHLNGPITSSEWVLHSCHNPACVRPEHLRVGTPHDNSMDMVDADRQPRSLPHDAVIDIRNRVTAGERQAALAREYGVSRQVIYGIVHRVRYKSVG